MAPRRVWSGISRTSRPSTRTAPAVGSIRRGTSSTNVDLPEPVRPTMPSDVPAGTSNETPSRTAGPSGVYRNVTSSKASAPSTGRASPVWGPSATAGSVSRISLIRDIDADACWTIDTT